MHGKKRRACIEIADYVLEKMFTQQLEDVYASLEPDVKAKFKDLIHEWNLTKEEIKQLCLMRMRR